MCHRRATPRSPINIHIKSNNSQLYNGDLPFLCSNSALVLYWELIARMIDLSVYERRNVYFRDDDDGATSALTYTYIHIAAIYTLSRKVCLSLSADLYTYTSIHVHSIFYSQASARTSHVWKSAKPPSDG